jgi:beta-galactosidase
MIEYWQWQTLRFGAETYWGGVLPHSGRPGRTYAELARLGAEFETAGPLVAGLEPDCDITIVYSTPSKWLMQKHPPLATPDGEPDPAAYHRILDPFYRGAFDAGRQVRIVHARQLHDPRGQREGLTPQEAVRRHPVLVVPALYLADDTTLDWLAAYAHAGGHLVLGPRTGYADHEARARHETAPARLADAAGVSYDEFSNLTCALPVRAVPGSALTLPENATATAWADGLTVTDADVLATYEHPHFGRWPAVTTRRHGEGRVTYVGTVPGRDLARSLAAWTAPAARSGWGELPQSVTTTTGTAPDGRRVHIVHNWSWEPASVHVPVNLADALNDTSIPAGTALDLGPWDVRVLVSPKPKE